MYPSGYRGVFASSNYDEVAAHAKAIVEEYGCEVHIVRTGDEAWAAGVPYSVYDDIRSGEPESEQEPHPLDRIGWMFALGDISQAAYDESVGYWETQRGQPDPRWSETDNLDMEPDED